MLYSSLFLSFVTTSYLSWSCLATAGPKVVGMDFTKRLAPNTITRRDDTVHVALRRTKVQYQAELEIGTPPRLFHVQIDTGSSDLFVPSIDEDYCQDKQEQCRYTGVYEPEKSSTSESLDLPFVISFGDKSEYNGSFYKDTVRLGGASLEKVQFGVSTKTANLRAFGDGTDTSGLIGVGFEANEATVDSVGTMYPNIISDLQANHLIKHKSFSLYLNGPDAPTGSILFGGLDASLYTGPLTAIPMIPKAGKTEVVEYAIGLTSLTLSFEGRDLLSDQNDAGIWSLLDSGTTFTQVPTSLLDSIYSSLSIRSDADLGAIAPCSLSKAPQTFEFGFGTGSRAKITVPISAFLRPYDDENAALTEKYGEPMCQPAVEASDGDDSIIIGDNFLRYMYLVYDLDNKIVAVAQADLSPSEERNVLEIESGSNNIPGAMYDLTKSPIVGNLTAVGTGTVISAFASASATGVGAGNISATGIYPPIASFTGAAVRRRGAEMGLLLAGAASGLWMLM